MGWLKWHHYGVIHTIKFEKGEVRLEIVLHVYFWRRAFFYCIGRLVMGRLMMGRLVIGMFSDGTFSDRDV